MTCPPCEFEVAIQHQVSPGVILGEEIMCRGAYASHLRANGKPKPSLIKDKDLLAGELSVWRLSDFCASTLDEIVQLLVDFGPADNELQKVFGVSAHTLRVVAIDGIEAARLFCVKDNCICDAGGNAHRLHAEIGLCKRLFMGAVSNIDPKYLALKGQLRLMFEQNELWQKAGQ